MKARIEEEIKGWQRNWPNSTAPQDVENRIYQFWLDGHYFHAKLDPEKTPYTIVIPPPNITGQLHMGHALDETLAIS